MPPLRGVDPAIPVIVTSAAEAPQSMAVAAAFKTFTTLPASIPAAAILYIPEGFAHGYYVMSDNAEITYKCSTIYHPEDERCIRWDDPDIGIRWPAIEPILSEKDINAKYISDAVNDIAS